MATSTASKAQTKQTVKNKVKAGSGNGHMNDGCEQIAKAVDYELNTLQIRFLRVLRDQAKKGPATREDLKKGTNHWLNRTGCHLKWIKTLRALCPKFVKEQEMEPQEGGSRKMLTYTIKADGLKFLEKAEKKAKEDAKAAK